MRTWNKFIESRRETAILIRQILGGVPQSPTHHFEGDVLTHTKLVRASIGKAIQELQNLKLDPSVGHIFGNMEFTVSADEMQKLYLASWLHDVGKPSSTTLDSLKGKKKSSRKWAEDPWEAGSHGRIRSIGHEDARHYQPQIDKFLNVAPSETIELYLKNKEMINFIIDHHMHFTNGKGLPENLFENGIIKNTEAIKLLLILMWADKIGRKPEENIRPSLQKNAETLSQNSIRAKAKEDADAKAAALPVVARNKNPLSPKDFDNMLRLQSKSREIRMGALKGKYPHLTDIEISGLTESFRGFFEATEMQFGFLESESAVELKAKILASNFLRSIRNAGGEIYFVGGAVRDLHMNLPSKDIDAMIKGIPLQTLATILSQHGKVDEVGQSFGIIKFSPNEFKVSEPLDLAIPRTERPMTPNEKQQYKTTYGKFPSAYQAFTTNSDHSLGVEEDLKRRDFTINAMAQDQHDNLIDPHGGMEDIKNQQIKMVDPKAFSQDPLRMLRAVQFAARFGFNIEPKTFEEIRNNSGLISGIPGERVLIEIEKIISKGDQFIGAKLLCATSLWQAITGLPCKNFGQESTLFERSKNMSEFIFLMLYKVTDFDNASKICNKLKCESVTVKQLKALYLAWDFRNDLHMTVFKMNKLHPTSLKLKVLPDEILEAIASDMPKSYGDLRINGDDMMSLGFKGEEIKKVFDIVIRKIFDGELKNSKDEILQFVKTFT